MEKNAQLVILGVRLAETQEMTVKVVLKGIGWMELLVKNVILCVKHVIAQQLVLNVVLMSLNK